MKSRRRIATPKGRATPKVALGPRDTTPNATERDGIVLCHCLALETLPGQRVHSRQSGRLDEVADAEMSHVRDSFGTMEVPEFRSGFLAGVHSGDSSAAGVMGRPLGDVVNFSRDDDPAIVSGVVQGDLFARDGACTVGGSSRHPELAGDPGVVGLGGAAEVPRS